MSTEVSVKSNEKSQDKNRARIENSFKFKICVVWFLMEWLILK